MTIKGYYVPLFVWNNLDIFLYSILAAIISIVIIRSYAKKILENFLNMLKDGSKLKINSLSEDQNTTMKSLSGVKQFPMRVKCATLAWHTFMHAAEGKKVTVNTEKAD